MVLLYVLSDWIEVKEDRGGGIKNTLLFAREAGSPERASKGGILVPTVLCSHSHPLQGWIPAWFSQTELCRS